MDAFGALTRSRLLYRVYLINQSLIGYHCDIKSGRRPLDLIHTSILRLPAAGREDSRMIEYLNL